MYASAPEMWAGPVRTKGAKYLILRPEYMGELRQSPDFHFSFMMWQQKLFIKWY